MRIPVAFVFLVVSSASVFAQGTPKFDVVSIRRNTTNALGSNGSSERPDGGFTLINVPIGTLISRAYPGFPPVDMTGLPDWAMSERYDVTATSPLAKATPEERASMMRAMLEDRVRLMARIEKREQPVYFLVRGRSDGTLGPRLKLADASIDCEARTAAERAAAEGATGQPSPRPRPDLTAPPPPCTIFTRGAQMEANVTMAGLAAFLRGTTGRPVIDKTALKGMYHVVMEYDRLARVTGPAVADTAAGPPSVFSALPEQLGLKLESGRAAREVLVIDRLERPSEN